QEHVALADQLPLLDVEAGYDPAVAVLHRLPVPRDRHHAFGIGAGVERNERRAAQQSAEERARYRRAEPELLARRIFPAALVGCGRAEIVVPFHVVHGFTLSRRGTTLTCAARFLSSSRTAGRGPN